jgi:quercetin dioxygenase-like cupin family protein
VPKAIVRPFGEGETVTDRPGRTIRILCAHDLLDLTWTRYEPGERGPDPHVHHRHVDAFYVLEGELVFGLGPDVEPVRASAGTFVAAPPNVVHTFGNESDARACFLNLHAPSTGFADNLRDRGSFDSHDPPADGGRPLSDGVVRLPGEGELFENEERVRWIKAELTELSVLELDVVPGWTVPAHHHGDHLDSFFVLDGEVELATADGPVPESSGTFIAAPPGAVHGISNTGTGRARLLNMHAPDAGFVARNR